MDTPLYDVYLTGKLTDGLTTDIAAQRLAALFKSTPAAMTDMLTGKPQLLKRGIDKTTALKYREALQKAGVEVAFKEVKNGETAPTSVSTAAPAPIAGLQLAPAGADLLRADERAIPPTAHIDTTHFSVAELSPFPPQHHAIEAATPDTSHLSLAPAGGELLNEAERAQPPVSAPDTSALSLAPTGAPLETLSETTAAVTPDISQLTLAPVGVELLSPEQRQRPSAVAPDTAHIQLEKY